MKNFDSIEEALNVDTEVVEDNKIEPRKNQLKKDDKNDSEKDYEYSRANLYSLVEKGQEAVNGILELAQESDSARAYEVAATTIKAVADTTDKLIDLQQKMKDLEQDPNKGPTNVTNALFVGSTAELSKLIKNQNKDDKIISKVISDHFKYYFDEIICKYNSKNLYLSGSIAHFFQNEIKNLGNLTRDNLEPIVNNLIKKHETNFKGVGQPLRVALTGSKFGPGLYDIVISLGKADVEKRLRKILN